MLQARCTRTVRDRERSPMRTSTAALASVIPLTFSHSSKGLFLAKTPVAHIVRDSTGIGDLTLLPCSHSSTSVVNG